MLMDSMGMTALQTNNAFWFITKTYFNSVDLIVFCIVKVFMVLLESENNLSEKDVLTLLPTYSL